ncbi:ATP-binding protein [Methylomonas sp. MED-D]|uniref:ATP-binding protein n=1 Tax=unclassified Methylomonas TaxID=2608980 RepID=UPI0008D958A6|nr:ATP-binding protein [Methylomonas sp. LWB]NJA08125.1 response regulator [Methylococcaceae bacterium WWC4]OHX37504.1 hybrid sensor histidine kinase/response regulator [Methylomonas sp. LWB]
MDIATSDTDSNATVLLVDDDPTNLTVFGQALAPYYDVLVANSGERALQLIRAGGCPDLILLDVMMPDMDGYQVIERLKADPATAAIPVIFVTALTSGSDEERGLQLGAVDYINKPCHLSILLARVRTHLELKKSRDWLQNQNAFLEAEVQRRQQENQHVHLQLLQSEKMAAIGQLAAGVAHEINNPIGFVTSNLNALNDYIADLFAVLDACDAAVAGGQTDSDALARARALKQAKNLAFLRNDIPELIAESREGLARVRRIIQDLKDFSHADENLWETADLHKGLDSTLNIIWNELKYHCTVSKQYGEVPPVHCLPSQLNQVFMNLLINAGQAIKTTGEIAIRTGTAGAEAWVEIADTGEGIAPEHLNRLFEPFFTTKPVGKGTGLGLSVSQNIIKKHGGRLEVSSELGRGSTFRVVLPISQT